MTAGNPKTENAKRYFEKLGLNADQVNKMESAINRQHQDPNKEKDFAHEIIQFAIFANDDSLFHSLVGPIIGNLAALGSYKGDVYSTRMDIDDMNSDLDAVNIYIRFGFNTGSVEGLLKTITDYNLSVLYEKVNRADEFLSNMGGGNIQVGLENLKKELNNVDMGAQYISQGSKSIMQDAFMADALRSSGAFFVDSNIYNNVSNEGGIGEVSQGGKTVEETKQAFLDYINAELKKK